MKFKKQQRQVLKQIKKHHQSLIPQSHLKAIKGGSIVEEDAEGI